MNCFTNFDDTFNRFWNVSINLQGTFIWVVGHRSIVDKSSAYGAKVPGFKTQWRKKIYLCHCVFICSVKRIVINSFITEWFKGDETQEEGRNWQKVRSIFSIYLFFWLQELESKSDWTVGILGEQVIMKYCRALAWSKIKFGLCES